MSIAPFFTAEGASVRQAYDIADHLASVIGPRPAASEGELRALLYVEEHVAATGAQVSRHVVDRIPGPGKSSLWLTSGTLIGLILVSALFQRAPWAAHVYLAAFFGLVPRLSAWLHRRHASLDGQSYNLLADHAPRGDVRGVLIIGAHIDTASARQVPAAWLRRAQRHYPQALQRFVVILALLALAQMVTDWLSPLPPQVWSTIARVSMAVAAILTLFHVIYLAVGRKPALSPGANDNGSSVGVVLTVADQLAAAESRPNHLALRYAFWTAEERGLTGSKRYVQEAQLDPDRTWMLNLDMVGTGRSLSYVRGVGMIPFLRTSRCMNRMLRQVLPGIRAVNDFTRSSDFKPFLSSGIPAASLTGKGGRRNWYYHTTEDISEHLQPELLQQAVTAVIGLVRALDESLTAAS